MRPGEKSGATAQVMLIEQVEGEGGPMIKGTLAWCGDSTCIMTDMAKGGEVALHTTSHTAGPDHQDNDEGTEAKQLLINLVKVRAKAEEATGLNSHEVEFTAEHIKSGLNALGSDAPPWGRPSAVEVMGLNRFWERVSLRGTVISAW